MKAFLSQKHMYWKALPQFPSSDKTLNRCHWPVTTAFPLVLDVDDKLSRSSWLTVPPSLPVCAIEGTCADQLFNPDMEPN